MIHNRVASFPGGFTVMMAVYKNDCHLLFDKAVRSIFNNTLIPDHTLIIVDGPIGIKLRDSINAIQNEFFNKIHFIWLPNNIGLARALNIGLQHVNTKWIVRADADDFNLPVRFETLASEIGKNSNIDLIGSYILEVDKEGNPLAIREVPVDGDLIHQFAKRRNPFNHMSVAYKLDAILECGGYPDIFLKEDYALWCEFLARRKKLINIPIVLVHATAGAEMYSRRGGWRYARSEYQMQRKMIDAGIKGLFGGILDGVMRAGFFLIPSWLRGYLYLKLLRKFPIYKNE